jgi:hypothetical protein
MQRPQQRGHLPGEVPEPGRGGLCAQMLIRSPGHRSCQRPGESVISAAVQGLWDGKEALEAAEEFGLPGEAASVSPPRYAQVAGFYPPDVVVIAGDKPGTAYLERERAG